MPSLSRDFVETRLPIKEGFQPHRHTPRRCNPQLMPQTKAEIERMLGVVSYPNFVRGPFLDDMRLLFGPCEVLGTHH